VESVVPPQPGAPVNEDADDQDSEGDQPIEPRDNGDHEVNAKELVGAFAERGMICSILRSAPIHCMRPAPAWRLSSRGQETRASWR
jgi:hypothetical protein